MNKKIALVLVMLLLALAFAGCTTKIDSPIPLPSSSMVASQTPAPSATETPPALQNPLVGRWQADDEGGGRVHVLNNDGSYAIEIKSESPEGTIVVSGEYEVLDGEAAIEDLSEVITDIDSMEKEEQKLYSVKFYYGKALFNDAPADIGAEEGSYTWMYVVANGDEAFFGMVDSDTTFHMTRG